MTLKLSQYIFASVSRKAALFYFSSPKENVWIPLFYGPLVELTVSYAWCSPATHMDSSPLPTVILPTQIRPSKIYFPHEFNFEIFNILDMP